MKHGGKADWGHAESTANIRKKVKGGEVVGEDGMRNVRCKRKTGQK